MISVGGNAVLMGRYEDETFTLTLSDGTVLEIDVEFDPEHMMSGHLPQEVIPWLM